MAIDLDRCTACQACVVACRQENNNPFAGPENARLGRAKFWMNLIHETKGTYPHVEMRFYPMPCMHCDKPPCTKVCPVDATHINTEGIVEQVYPRCIGVRMCVSNCPYTVRYFNWYPPHWPEEYKKGLNPDVYVRRKGITEKCNFCIQRIRKAKLKAKKENRKIRDGEVIPACAETCPSEAITFGDLNDSESRVSRLFRSRRAFRLLEELGTHPKVCYLKEGEWHD
ncbi:MAG: 4Fe-4S dicluster domain-containing protein [Deltaproteobacteria bacterium]|nr:MAG: 4Fe-4S dicluster domain-containing protein [Deltaproteobacteria bacterium]